MLALVNGIREPREVKKKYFNNGGKRTHDLRNGSTVALPTKLRGQTERVGDDLGDESLEEKVRIHMIAVPRLTL